MDLSHSLHKYLAHSGDLIRLNDNYGLAQWSEAPLEGKHKFLRRFRLRLARMTSLKDNLFDVFSRLWMQSVPLIRALKPKKSAKFHEIMFRYDDDKIFESFLLENVQNEE